MKPEILEKLVKPAVADWNIWELPLEPVNNLLKGTNLYAYNAHGAYNELEPETDVRKGLFGKRTEQRKYYQSGVAYVAVNLWPIQVRISMMEDEEYFARKNRDEIIENANRRFQEKTGTLQLEKDRLFALQTSNPKRFFGTPQS